MLKKPKLSKFKFNLDAPRLNQTFFQRNTCTVAQELLGKVLVFNAQFLLINETEAYAGFDDPASHAARGPTKRCNIMFGAAGLSYAYLIYGMYHCLNIVTEPIDYPAAVLIRGGYLLDPQGQVLQNLNGPGKVCRALGIDLSHNGLDVTATNEFCVINTQTHAKFAMTPRIGIKKGLDKHWRFLAVLD